MLTTNTVHAGIVQMALPQRFWAYLFIWLRRVLAVARWSFTASRRVFRCGAQILELWCTRLSSCGMWTL